MIALNRLKEKFPDFDYECVGWSEIEPSAIAAHNALFPELTDKNYGDIANIDWSTVQNFDLFTYSSPCTDFSIAGNMDGGEKGSGTRSSLLWECERAIREKRPKYCVLENVTALVSKAFLPLFLKWVETVNSYGYESFWQTLNAKDYGVPHNRDRVFLVSIRKDNPKEIIQYNFPNKIELTKKVEDYYEQGIVDKKYYVRQDAVDKWCVENEERIVECIAERNHLSEDSVQYIEENETIDKDMAEKKTRKKKEKEPVSIPLIVDEPPVVEKDIQEEIEEECCETYNAGEYETEDAWTADTSTGKKRKKEKPIIEYLTEKDKKLRKGTKCIKRIPTPTCSDGSAPTLMATGYANADYKNFYSVGHFPKLGIFEVWKKTKD